MPENLITIRLLLHRATAIGLNRTQAVIGVTNYSNEWIASCRVCMSGINRYAGDARAMDGEAKLRSQPQSSRAT